MTSDEENILVKMKSLADSTLDSIGMIPPDKLITMVKRHEESLKQLEKKIKEIQYQLNNLKKNKKQNKKNRTPIDENDYDLGGFDVL